MNSVPTETASMLARMTSMMLGGIRMPSVPDDAMVAVARRLS